MLRFLPSPNRKSAWRYLSVLFFLGALYLAIIWVFSPNQTDRPNPLGTTSGRGGEAGAGSASPHSRSRKVTQSRRGSTENVVGADHPKIRTVLELVQEFEKSRTEVTFNSDINGRRKVFMDIVEPSDRELRRIRDAVSQVSELWKMDQGVEVKWSDFITKEFFLETPTSFSVMIGESRKGSMLNYTISPMESGRQFTPIRGGVKTEVLEGGDVTWRFSHLISFGPDDESQGRISE
jgi:hypothetical protein